MRSMKIRTVLAAAAIAVTTSGVASATDYTWIGSQPSCTMDCGTWLDTTAWSPNGVPGPDDSATVGGMGSIPVDGVTINKLTLGADISLVPYKGVCAIVVKASQGNAGLFEGKGGTLGNCTLTVAADSSTAISAGLIVEGGSDLVLQGATIWTGGVIRGAGDGKIHNFGVFAISTDAGFGYSGGLNTATFFNMPGATVEYATGGKTLLGHFWTFDDAGTVDVPSGTLVLSYPSNGIHYFRDGAKFTGAGKTLVGFDDMTADEVQLEGNVTIAPGATVEIAYAGTTWHGNATVSGGGTLLWSGGTLDSAFSTDTITIAAGTTLTIAGEDVSMNGGAIIDNQGTTTWSGTGQIRAAEGSTFVNHGTFTATGDSKFGYSGGTNGATFHNVGTFVRDADAGETVVSGHWTFENGGVVDVKTGTLHVGDAGWMQLDDGTFQGAGRTLVGEPTDDTANVGLTLKGKTTIAAGHVFGLASPTNHDGTVGSFDGKGTFQWTGGHINGDANPDVIVTFAPDLVVLLTGAGTRRISVDPGSVVFAGTTTWQDDGTLEVDDGTAVNTGTFTQTGNGTLAHNSSGAVFDNKGTYVKDASGVTTVYPGFTNDGGTLEVKNGTMDILGGYDQPSGTTKLSGGTFARHDSSMNPQNVELVGGSVVGHGTIVAATTTIDGVIAPGDATSTGTIAITGDYVQSSTSELDVDLGGTTAGSQFDVVAVSGKATIDGALKVGLQGPYLPAKGDSYKVVTFASGTGMYAKVTPPANVMLSTTYEPEDVLLGVTDVVATGGTGGTGGSGGTSNAGAGGTSNAGSGGTSNAGAGGTSNAGSGGTAGTPGTAGQGGAAGKGGTTSATGGKGGGTTGAAGAGTAGTGGSAAPTGDTSANGDASGSGCGCVVATGGNENDGGRTLLGIGLAFAAIFARRRRGLATMLFTLRRSSL